MELYIETLTGAAFELRVSPFETIMSVKAKIQRLEGIPIAQQHLIWNSMELEDDYCLHDYSIHEGATLKLVLAMRGGPINTRRIPMEDPQLREMAEYVEANRDEIWEKLPGNRQVTLLVFREGDQLNFFRVVDRGDGTLTPLSESLSGASMYNFNDEEEEEEAPSKEKVEENEHMREKIRQLRFKMEKINISKKPRRKPHPPSSGRSTSGRSTKLRHLPSTSYSLGPVLNKNLCLPPVGHSVLQHHLPSQMKISSEKEKKESTEKDSQEESKPGSPKKQAENQEKSLGQALTCVKEDEAEKGESAASAEVLKEKSLKNAVESDTANCDNTDNTTVTSAKKHDLLRLSSLNDASSSRSVTSSKKKDVSLETLRDSLRPPNSSKGKSKLKGDLSLFESLRESLGKPTNSSKFSGLEKRKEFTLESLTTSEARAMSGLLRQASLEKVGSSRIGNITVTSASKTRVSGNYTLGNTTFQEGRITTPEGRLMSARLQRMTSSRDGRLLSPTHRLPPVKSKKKAAKRCFVCGKKTGLASSYQCRCGNNFCATHRYAESHECTFDYKTEGRKLLEQNNPVVSAPKLPKI
ncbi:hypothetical protein CHS0354_005944 [Potamilus streckersoni]|uniref:AN1-type zinc finger protein 4 n=1 Tax=Potamilus streckersoni TaxID=2493646 RepID=A0AAE0VYJ7_9BIVA|nr:hypothetical protein CHS0354_005944 [Potamilus streckersoni]